jgi:hypothetical protein
MSTLLVRRTFAHYGRQIRVFRRNEPETEKNHDCVAEESEFELASPLLLQLRRTELLGTAPEKQGSIFTQCFSTRDIDNDRPSDIRAFWAANSHFQVERTGDGEKA